jgi:hypothetical protein
MRNCNGMEQENRSCGCKSPLPYENAKFPVAMAYVPWQKFTSVYEPDKALEIGTIFPELNLPFYGGRGCGRR